MEPPDSRNAKSSSPEARGSNPGGSTSFRPSEFRKLFRLSDDVSVEQTEDGWIVHPAGTRLAGPVVVATSFLSNPNHVQWLRRNVFGTEL